MTGRRGRGKRKKEEESGKKQFGKSDPITVPRWTCEKEKGLKAEKSGVCPHTNLPPPTEKSSSSTDSSHPPQQPVMPGSTKSQETPQQAEAEDLSLGRTEEVRTEGKETDEEVEVGDMSAHSPGVVDISGEEEGQVMSVDADSRAGAINNVMEPADDNACSTPLATSSPVGLVVADSTGAGALPLPDGPPPQPYDRDHILYRPPSSPDLSAHCDQGQQLEEKWVKASECFPSGNHYAELVATPLYNGQSRNFVHLVLTEQICSHLCSEVFFKTYGMEMIRGMDEYWRRGGNPEDEHFSYFLAMVMEYGLCLLKLMGQGMTVGLSNCCSNDTPMTCVKKLVSAWREVRGWDRTAPSGRIPLAVRPAPAIAEGWQARMTELRRQVLQVFEPQKVVAEMVNLHKIANETTTSAHLVRWKVRKAVRDYFRNFNPESFVQMDITTMAVIDELREEMAARKLREERIIKCREAEMFGYLLNYDMNPEQNPPPAAATNPTN